MSDLIVLTFEDTDSADKMRDALKRLERDGLLDLEDAAVVVRGQDGKLHRRDEVSRSMKIGVFGGAMTGLLLGFMFPLAGLAIGAGGGALVAKSLDNGVDPTFVKEVGDALKPGHAALFAVVRSANVTATLAAMRQFEGQVHHSTLSSDTEAELRRALADKTP